MIKTKSQTVLCWICCTNKAVMKGYWTSYEGTDNEQSEKLLTCGVCAKLNWKSVSKLERQSKEERLVTIKAWWAPDKRTTTLRLAYPAVDWEKVGKRRD
jgi:hypothetical protein